MMLGFFRKYAAVFGMVIVVGFGVTLFTGSVFFGLGSGGAQSEQPVDASLMVAKVGRIPVMRAKFQEYLADAIRGADPVSLRQNPEYLEAVRYSAFERAVQFALFLHGGEVNDIPVKRREIKGELERVYIRFDLKNKKELKQSLKENRYPYSVFMDNLKSEIRAQKFKLSLESRVSVSDADVENVYRELTVQHILFDGMKEGVDRDALRAKSQAVYEEISDGVSFDDAVEKYSDDLESKESKGILSKPIRMGDSVLAFEAAAFALKEGEVSVPLETPFGWHIVRVVEDRKLPKPLDFDLEKEKATLLQAKKRRAVYEYIGRMMRENELVILDPELEAYQKKTVGDSMGAIRAYQGLATRYPNNPIPLFLLARVYVATGQDDAALAAFLKAEALGEGSPHLDLPVIHFELGRLYKRQKNKVAANVQFDKAVELAGENVEVLKQLRKAFGDLKEPRLVKRLAKTIAEAKKKEAAEAEATSNQDKTSD